jgi:predicted AAA+ superfamily ATPase
MKKRSFWVEQIGKAWERRSVIWLSGVRRVGKTFLSQSLADAEYFDQHTEDRALHFIKLSFIISS